MLLFGWLVVCRVVVVVVCVAVVVVVVVVVCRDTLKNPRVYIQKRRRVYRHHAHMCYHMRAWCQQTRGTF